jgi:hypothetical protein
MDPAPLKEKFTESAISAAAIMTGLLLMFDKTTNGIVSVVEYIVPLVQIYS